MTSHLNIYNRHRYSAFLLVFSLISHFVEFAVQLSLQRHLFVSTRQFIWHSTAAIQHSLSTYRLASLTFGLSATAMDFWDMVRQTKFMVMAQNLHFCPRTVMLSLHFSKLHLVFNFVAMAMGSWKSSSFVLLKFLTAFSLDSFFFLVFFCLAELLVDFEVTADCGSPWQRSS